MKDECQGVPCSSALENPKKIGRASWACETCGRDISLHVILLAEAMERAEELENQRNGKNKGARQNKANRP